MFLIYASMAIILIITTFCLYKIIYHKASEDVRRQSIKHREELREGYEQNGISG